MTTNRPMRGMAVLAAGALVWGISAAPASADSIREGQWALRNYHVTTDVWPISQGDGVTVAVIDTGVADHQDLAGQVLPGADFSGEGVDYKTDKVGHGTGMASLIAGRGHGDQAGIIGLAPKAKILPIRIGTFDVDSGTAGSGDFAKSLRYAVDNGAKVVNMSFVGSGSSDLEMREAVNYAAQKDVVMVGAAGNFGADRPVIYPAAFPGVVAVTAVDQQGNIWSKANNGPEVTLAAPGIDIYSATAKSSSSYGKGNGTSGAAAYVSAIAALVRAKYPDLSAGQVINRMIKSAVAPPDKSPVPNNKYGYGIASAKGALAPNPAVDNGPKENPLLTRTESQADPTDKPSSAASKPAPGSTAPDSSAAAKDDSGIPVYVLAIVGVLALVVIGGVIVLVRRSRGNGNGSGGGGNGGGGGGFVPPGPPPYGPGAQQFPPQQQAPHAGQGQPQQSSYAGEGQGQPQAYGTSQPYQQYPPQQPPAGGTPYR
ncbi:type VII secretion-associated serine protease mycosin [Kitasatospora sp. NPDC085879]|uniref:type VII secretion-associated serine protease mycosin n=1 Tax=Kitasatospora sp. NPDC085879 TaxID=3154769 RepID=UPI003423A83E